jgi:hypothetical protein
MIFESQILVKHLFHGLISYKKYIKNNSLHKLVGIKLNSLANIRVKKIKPLYYSVNPNIKEAFAAELDDLTRLHYLIISRKVTTILEFGIGKSTLIFNDALIKNKKKYKEFVGENLRRSNSFECHSVDNHHKWIKKVRLNNNLKNVNYYHTQLKMGTFNGRACTFYKNIPNVCPDFIYLDGPDQFSAKGFVNGISTNHPDRLPMAGDILVLEHFFLPGTLLVVDGRTANARFLKTNLQRDWIYCYDKNADQHYFELSEDPVGVYNKKQINFCLGISFYDRLKKKYRVIINLKNKSKKF